MRKATTTLSSSSISRPAAGPSRSLIWTPPAEAPLPQALATTKNADVVIAVVGINSDLEGEESSVDIPGFKGGDRTTIDLPPEEEDLLKAVKTQGKPLVVVLMNGSALAVNWANENANAIVEAWYPGEEGGAAVAETLAGANNPCRTPPRYLLQKHRAVAAVRRLLP